MMRLMVLTSCMSRSEMNAQIWHGESEGIQQVRPRFWRRQAPTLRQILPRIHLWFQPAVIRSGARRGVVAGCALVPAIPALAAWAYAALAPSPPGPEAVTWSLTLHRHQS